MLPCPNRSEVDNWTVKDGLDGEGDGFKGFVHQVVIDNYLYQITIRQRILKCTSVDHP